MAVTFIQQKKKQRYFLIVFLVVLGVVLVIAGGRFIQKKIPPAPLVVTSGFAQGRDIDINFEALKHPIFQELGDPTAPIPFPEEVGREIPFFPL